MIGRQGAGASSSSCTVMISRDHAAMRAKGVAFLEETRTEAYGIVAVFDNLYGNIWDLIQHTQ